MYTAVDICLEHEIRVWRGEKTLEKHGQQAGCGSTGSRKEQEGAGAAGGEHRLLGCPSCLGWWLHCHLGEKKDEFREGLLVGCNSVQKFLPCRGKSQRTSRLAQCGDVSGCLLVVFLADLFWGSSYGFIRLIRGILKMWLLMTGCHQCSSAKYF